MKEGDNGTLKINWKPSAGSPVEELNSKIRDGSKVVEGLV